MSTDCQGALRKAQQFLTENRNMAVGTRFRLYYLVISKLNETFDSQGQKPIHEDYVAALAFINGGIEELGQSGINPDNRMWLQIFSVKTALRDDQGTEAAKRIEDNWKDALTYSDFWVWTQLRRDLYLRQGREDQIVPMIQSVIEDRLELRSQLDPLLCQLMSDTLRDQDHAAEALSWAKLNYMLCSFSDDDIAASTRTLTSDWMYTMSAPQAQAFVAAQTDAASPNPLKSVALPAFSDKMQQSLKAATNKAKADKNTPAVVSLLLAQGDYRAAMLQARNQLAVEGNENSLRQVAMVFKAKDLNLVRANQFLSFYQKGEGINPMGAFLEETAVSSTTTDTANRK